MLLRIQILWWLSAVVSLGSCRTLLELLQTTPDLSILYSHVNASSNVTSLLANANNFTLFAPNNQAIDSFISSSPTNLTKDRLEAILQYSLLRGGFPSLSFSNNSQFPVSNLLNSSYTNVTAGQSMELVAANAALQVVTGNKTISTLTSMDNVCIGGIVHIVDEVLSIPVGADLEITESNLQYFISILNLGGYLNSVNTNYVNAILQVPDVTYFIPNSASALAKATELAKNVSSAELEAMFEYHIVPGFVGYSPLLQDGMVLKTQQGDNLTVTIQEGNTYVNAVRITASNYIVANGVIHVIEDLLNRSDTSPPPKPSSSTVASSPATTAPTSTASGSGTSMATPTTTSAAIAGGNTSSTGSTSHSRSAIGIGVGVTLAGLLILGGLAWFLWRRKQKAEARAWDDRIMSNVHNEKGEPFDGSRGYTPKRPDGSESAYRPQSPQSMGSGMRGIRSMHLEDSGADVKNPPPGTYIIRQASTTSRPSVPNGPSVPPRSPGRGVYGEEF